MKNLSTYQEHALSAPSLPYASDAPVREDLERLGYIDLRRFESDDVSSRSQRCRIRYLAALFPSLDLPQLAEVLHAVIANDGIDLSDMRLILEGRRLSDPSKFTGEIPIDAIQTVGKVLSAGGNRLDAARRARISIDSVEAIDGYLELSQAYEDRLMDLAVTAVRENWTVSQLASVSGMSRSRAHRYMVRSRSVLVEIGEVQP